jgi:DNA-binding transcriptional ArsR family regulator
MPNYRSNRACDNPGSGSRKARGAEALPAARAGELQVSDLMDVLRALADDNRLRVLRALQGGELCVCRLIALLARAPSTVSQHLSLLRAARLVESRKEGRWLYYRLASESRVLCTRRVLALLFADLDRTARGREDRRRLGRICREDAESLCRKGDGPPAGRKERGR